MTQHPLIQIVNEADQPTGSASMNEAYQRGLLHRVVLIFVEDAAGKLLLQKRAPNVATNPNKWDFSAAGHVDAGEDYLTAGKRELGEELGLHGFNLEELDTFRSSAVTDGHILNRFIRLYKVVVPTATSITIHPDEVSEVQLLSIAAAKQFAADHPDQVTNDFVEYLAKYY